MSREEMVEAFAQAPLWFLPYSLRRHLRDKIAMPEIVAGIEEWIDAYPRVAPILAKALKQLKEVR